MALVLSKEVFWYTVALPELSVSSPALRSVCAECYFGASNYVDGDTFLRPSFGRRNCCMPVWMVTEPSEEVGDNHSFKISGRRQPCTLRRCIGYHGVASLIPPSNLPTLSVEGEGEVTITIKH